MPFNRADQEECSLAMGRRTAKRFRHPQKRPSRTKSYYSFQYQAHAFRLETDASNYAIGGVLHQIIDGKPRPLGFFSKTFNDAERNYQIYDKELRAMMAGLQNWRHFLRNGPEFDIWTDHRNLQYFREPQKVTPRQARAASELAEFNYKMHHRPGTLNKIADALSCKDEPEGGVNDNKDVTVPSRRTI